MGWPTVSGSGQCEDGSRERAERQALAVPPVNLAETGNCARDQCGRAMRDGDIAFLHPRSECTQGCRAAACRPKDFDVEG